MTAKLYISDGFKVGYSKIAPNEPIAVKDTSHCKGLMDLIRKANIKAIIEVMTAMIVRILEKSIAKLTFDPIMMNICPQAELAIHIEEKSILLSTIKKTTNKKLITTEIINKVRM